MGKLMSLEVLSSIKGAEASDAINELFKTILEAQQTVNSKELLEKEEINAVLPETLRDDMVIKCSDETVRTIKENFPREKNGYLVVPKVIDE